MKIKIINDPGGDPPSEIRQAWIGLILELDPKMPQPMEAELTTVTRIEKQPTQEVYLVTIKKALDKLKAKNRKAYEWWWINTHFPLHPERHFAFLKSACEIVE